MTTTAVRRLTTTALLAACLRAATGCAAPDDRAAAASFAVDFYDAEAGLAATWVDEHGAAYTLVAYPGDDGTPNATVTEGDRQILALRTGADGSWTFEIGGIDLAAALAGSAPADALTALRAGPDGAALDRLLAELQPLLEAQEPDGRWAALVRFLAAGLSASSADELTSYFGCYFCWVADESGMRICLYCWMPPMN